MIHSMLTVAVPFDEALAKDVEGFLDDIGNPVRASTRSRLDDAEFMHFMSINVIHGDERPSAFIVMEFSADGAALSVYERIAVTLDEELTGLFECARISLDGAPMTDFLARHQHNVGQGWFSTPGLNFDGSPEMSVSRIRKEAALAKRVGDLLDTPRQFRSSLEILNWVRSKLWAEEAMKWAFVAEPAPCLEGKPDFIPHVPSVLWSAVQAFLWPLLLFTAVALALIWSLTGGAAAVWLTVLLFVLEGGVFAGGYLALRRKETTDVSDVPLPAPGITAEIMTRESFTAHNHLAAVSIMKPGWLRRYTLRLGLWAATQLAAYGMRPGFLGDTGVIHFARWILLPGTDKLLFFSNFDAPWESYIQDFIQIAPNGVTGIWSNTVGFPRTEKLFKKGAVDGNRLTPWNSMPAISVALLVYGLSRCHPRSRPRQRGDPPGHCAGTDRGRGPGLAVLLRLGAAARPDPRLCGSANFRARRPAPASFRQMSDPETLRRPRRQQRMAPEGRAGNRLWRYANGAVGDRARVFRDRAA